MLRHKLVEALIGATLNTAGALVLAASIFLPVFLHWN